MYMVNSGSHVCGHAGLVILPVGFMLRAKARCSRDWSNEKHRTGATRWRTERMLLWMILTERKTSVILVAVAIVEFAGAVFGATLPEVAIPGQSDWTERGVVLRSGPSGSWDARVYGQISPCTVVKKDGVFYLYYVGASGNRGTDGGPKNRALGIATSTDGIHFTKYSGNPIITHQPSGNAEEGVFSAGATAGNDDRVLLYYGAIWAENASTEEVHCHVALAGSGDGKSFKDYGYILSWNDPSVWGYGDEIFPLGAYYADGRYNVYYGAKGRMGAWKLGVATGSYEERLTHSRAVLTEGQIVGGCDPVFICENRIALFVVHDFEENYIEVRTADVVTPERLSDPVETYRMFPPRYRHTAVYLDRDQKKWFMYQATDRASDGNHIVAKTAPMRLVRKTR